jgi:small-conductance mechanosensitive channel
VVLKDLQASWQSALTFLDSYPIAMSAVIFVLSLLLANVVAWLVTKVVGSVVKRTRVNWDDKVLAIIHRPLFWTVLCVGLLSAALPLGLPATALAIFQSVVATVLVIIWASFFSRFVRIVLHAMSHGGKEASVVRPQTRPLFENVAFMVIFVVAIYVVFRSWNIDMTAWLASAGIVGIAIGFAAKDTLANLFSGVFILADAPYKIGDYVVLDSGERGQVTRIGIRSTRLQTRDDVEITIPNAIIGNSRIVNESGGPHEKFRIRVNVGVAYGSDIDQVKSVLMDVALKEPQVCDDPEPRVRFRTFGASSLDIVLLCWVENPEMRGRVLDLLNTAIYKSFKAEGIEIPYSKHDVYIKELPEGRNL